VSHLEGDALGSTLHRAGQPGDVCVALSCSLRDGNRARSFRGGLLGLLLSSLGCELPFLALLHHSAYHNQRPLLSNSWSARATVNEWELGARGEVAAQRADLNLESPFSRRWQTLRKAGSKRKRQFGRLKQAAGRHTFAKLRRISCSVSATNVCATRLAASNNRCYDVASPALGVCGRPASRAKPSPGFTCEQRVSGGADTPRLRVAHGHGSQPVLHHSLDQLVQPHAIG